MFGKKDKLGEYILEQRIKGIAAIREAINEQETKAECMYSYGVIDALCAAGVITLNERADFKSKATAKENERAKAQREEWNKEK